MDNWTIGKLLSWTTEYYQKNKLDSPRLEAEILLAHTLGLKRIELYLKFEQVVKTEQLAQFKSYLQRRLKHEPLAYLTHNQPFMSLDFYVDQNVLIPRPETELLVENCITLIRHSSFVIRHSTILDLGTGSGCIAISLAKFLPEISVVGLDSSPEAIAVAKKNAAKLGVADRCHFLVGDMLNFPNVGAGFTSYRDTQYRDMPARSFDIIVSNPPYIPTAEIEKLQPEVKDWEPRQALDGGADGLNYIRQILKVGSNHCTTALLFEFGCGQAPAIKALDVSRFKEVKIIKDLNGLERIWSGEINRLQTA
jgi:release factor glutamine methyltransferase